MTTDSRSPNELLTEQKRTLPAQDCIDSRVLLQGREAISILHHGELYRLRETKQGKLILTK
jgi:hemin uptake protein HemP